MGRSSLLLVRHASAVISSGEPPGAWPLSDAGRRAARALGRRLAERLPEAVASIRASDERKAIETAAAISGTPPQVDPRLREVDKPWYERSEDHEVDAIRYLRNSHVAGWEPQCDVVDRFDAAVTDAVDRGAAVTTHGTAMSLWLSTRLPDLEPAAFWRDLRFPDAVLLQLDAEPAGQGALTRV